MTYQPIQLTDVQIQHFQEDGFLIVENFLPIDFSNRPVDRMEPLLQGQFETGIYPDEWYWRPGLSLPDVTREICNGWKCDLTIASLVLSAEIGRLTATLAGWEGARIGQDSLWMKPPGAKEIAMHQDGAYMDKKRRTIDLPSRLLRRWIVVAFLFSGLVDCLTQIQQNLLLRLQIWESKLNLPRVRDFEPKNRSKSSLEWAAGAIAT
ncbi:hypothetical protein [Phormidesmis sp. 146-33]